MESATKNNTLQPISLTEEAVEELNNIRKNEGIPKEYALRVGVKGGGCAGFSYILGFDSPKDNDEHFEISDLPVIIDKSHSLYLVGMQIDYHNGLNNRGFTFTNPNASETCGCGTSFSA